MSYDGDPYYVKSNCTPTSQNKSLISFDKFGETNKTPSNTYSYLLDPAWVHASNFLEYTIPCNQQAITVQQDILKKYW